MDILKQYWLIIIIFLVAISFNFYWHELRPFYIKKACYQDVSKVVQTSVKDKYTTERISAVGSTLLNASEEELYNPYYKICLQSKGL
jgi:hypothetical protein